MSTKTTIKRIALVAVAALGLGVVAGIPANAGRTLANTTNVNSISVSTDAAPVAGATGNSAVHTFTFTTDSTASAPTISPWVKLTSKPSTSAMNDTQTAYSSSAIASKVWQVSSAALTHTPSTWTATGGTNLAAGADLSCATLNAAGNYTCKIYVHANYDVPGNYVWTVLDDSNNNGVVDAGDYAQSFTVVVGSASGALSAVGGLTAFNSTSAASGSSGSLLKITLKDAAGNALSPDQAAGVKITVTGSAVVAKVNNATPSGTGGSTYTLGAGAFDGTGTAYVNVTDSTAETIYASLSGIGFNAFTAPASVALTFKTITATATAALTTVLDSATNPKAVSSTSYQYNGKAQTVSFKTNTAAATYDKVTVTDAGGVITGKASATYDIAVLGATTGTDKGSFGLVLGAATTTSTTFTVNGGSTITLAPTAAAAASITNLTASSVRAAAGAKITVTAKVKDQYGAAYANQTVTPTISGRNSTLTLSNMVSDASGLVTFSYTDASTSTVNLSDTVTLTAGSYTASTSITFTSSANLGVATISLVTPSETTAGTVNTPAVNSAIYAGDGAETGAVSVTATVKDANGVTIAGVPVTFSVSGTGAAITSTTQTVVTGATGTAVGKLYAWLAGKYTVTATYGTVSDTATSTWTQEDGTYARTISVVAKDASAIATVKDRFGNPVKGVSLNATRVGVGNFGGSSSATGTTDANGQAEFILQNGAATVTVAFTTSTYGQSDALKGLIDGTTSTNTFTATTAGTSLVDEAGVGASYDAAGVNSASADVSATGGSSDAVDAANEATDAANAATDAANAAAEAADAATAAAQDAQAAVAALATQVASLVAGIKAQITSLTNLVIKIQKKVKA